MILYYVESPNVLDIYTLHVLWNIAYSLILAWVNYTVHIPTHRKKEITKAKLIEVRLKYLLANANKQEDRLTQRDIDEAGKLTGIFT